MPEDADLVVVGNPTNPTGVLHPRALLASLVRPDRVVVADEAFMDAVPGEPESLVGTPGVLVLRSLTKTWALPGVRAGYVVGDPAHLAELSRLSARGLMVAGDPATPFVLVNGPTGLRERLREQGFAVRRGDTFPGLGPDWIRIAVRDPATTDRLLGALDRVAVGV